MWIYVPSSRRSRSPLQPPQTGSSVAGSRFSRWRRHVVPRIGKACRLGFDMEPIRWLRLAFRLEATEDIEDRESNDALTVRRAFGGPMATKIRAIGLRNSECSRWKVRALAVACRSVNPTSSQVRNTCHRMRLSNSVVARLRSPILNPHGFRFSLYTTIRRPPRA